MSRSKLLTVGAIILCLASAAVLAASKSKTSKSPCPVDTAKSHFIDDCTGAMYGYAGDDGDKLEQECRCVARHFKVENFVDSACGYSIEDIRDIMATDKVHVACR